MITEYLVKFTDFLNGYAGYSVTNSDIERYLEAQAIETHLEDENDVIQQMRVFFCRNQREHEEFPELFRMFYKYNDYRKEMEKLTNEQRNHRSVFENKKSEVEEKIDHIKDKIRKNQDQIEESNHMLITRFSKKDRKFLEENRETIQNDQEFSEEDKKRLGELIFSEEEQPVTDREINEFKKKIMGICEEAILDEDIERFNVMKKFFDVLDRTKSKKAGTDNSEKKDLTKELKEKKKRLEKEKEEIQAEQQRITQNIRKRIDEIENEVRIIKKKRAEKHRDKFYGKNAVQLNTDGTPEFMKKEFTKLSRKDIHNTYMYIRRNILKFKTRLARHIASGERRKPDIKTTIQKACRTNGLPMQLCYEKPKRSRANLVLVLDISGSCKEASKMMLSFMYLLKDAFPGGCHTFVFINRLYNVSEIMEARNIDDAVDGVLEAIPTHGVYSDYYRPLNTLWSDYHSVIKKDSLVIFMGDARNNKNKSGEEYMKNIRSRAQEVFWLNTEKTSGWGQGDSIAPIYMNYSRMAEITSPAELVRFIEKM